MGLFSIFKKRRYYIRHDIQADIRFVSFPKCGRTWVRYILGLMLKDTFKLDAPVLEVGELTESLDIPTIEFYHEDDPFWKRPEELNQDFSSIADGKVVFLVRDPRDVVVSAFFEKSKRGGARYGNRAWTGTLDDFLKEPVGSLDTIIAYFNVWYRSRAQFKGFHLLKYEALHENTIAEIRALCAFCEFDFATEALIAKAIEEAKFEKMRKLEKSGKLRSPRLTPIDPKDEESFKTRKGKIGGYREQMTEDQIAYVNERIDQKLDPALGYCTT